MVDIIQLLPDAIVNQIAAGEVIQRPASVVKELLENAVDAGATKIKVHIKESGKSLIQVADNGKGMSVTDARLCFERHATSKIRSANDLFSINTNGFRGEALASIASIAQVTMKTRRPEDEIGTLIKINAGEFLTQEPCECPIGTQITVKNLFFSLPARRKFLKSNAVEMRHIVDEFQRIAIAHPDIQMNLDHDNQEVFRLRPAKLRQRIVGVLGSKTNQKLVPVEEETDLMAISGFVGKPEFSKRSRGEQFLYVNNRYVRSAYFNHAVFAAYQEILPDKHFPLFVLFIRVDPAFVDVNIHPTKQEVKFEDERLVYNYIKVAVRHALGKHQVIPTLDFSQDQVFSAGSGKSMHPSTSGKGAVDRTHEQWKILLGDDDGARTQGEGPMTVTIQSDLSEDAQTEVFGHMSADRLAPYQVHNQYIISPIKSGFLLIDQQAASERILFEQYAKKLDQKEVHAQKLMFPQSIQCAPADDEAVKELLPDLQRAGFDIQPFGQMTYVVHGIPEDLPPDIEIEPLLESCIDQLKHQEDVRIKPYDIIAKMMSRRMAIKRGKALNEMEMTTLIDQLFACEYPYKSPFGRSCFITYELSALDKKFTE